jgi:hypothetical protein
MPLESASLDAPLSAEEVAGKEILVTTETLASWRSQGRGPAYHKDGRVIWYTRRDIQAWRESCKRAPEPAAARRQRKALAAEAGDTR